MGHYFLCVKNIWERRGKKKTDGGRRGTGEEEPDEVKKNEKQILPCPPLPFFPPLVPFTKVFYPSRKTRAQTALHFALYTDWYTSAHAADRQSWAMNRHRDTTCSDVLFAI